MRDERGDASHSLRVHHRPEPGGCHCSRRCPPLHRRRCLLRLQEETGWLASQAISYNLQLLHVCLLSTWLDGYLVHCLPFLWSCFVALPCLDVDYFLESLYSFCILC